MEIMLNPLDNVPEGEPAMLVAGDTWVWQRSDLASDFPTATYSLSYSLQREGDVGAPTLIVATESGNVYKVTVDAATSAGKAAGTWRWTAYMVRTADSARVAIATGILIVKANPAAAFDARSHAVKVLAAIESLIEGRATSDVNSYSIAGRSLTKLSVDELLTWRSHYRREVRRERDAANAASGKPTGRTQVVRFS
jgi:hypothetical protein